MFTGIIEEIGEVQQVVPTGGGVRLIINASASAKELKVNDSIAVNGTCQTVVRKQGDTFEVEAVEETLKKTTFGAFKEKDKVNLELPMKLNERLGGHLVLGHIDTVGIITAIGQRENSTMVSIDVPAQFSKYLIHVGSICIDGVSLTIAGLQDHNVTVSIIPHTMEHTIFKLYKIGTNVNVEFDVVGKYIERMVSSQNIFAGKSSLTEEELNEQGY
jgi:riboflavin synthase